MLFAGEAAEPPNMLPLPAKPEEEVDGTDPTHSIGSEADDGNDEANNRAANGSSDHEQSNTASPLSLPGDVQREIFGDLWKNVQSWTPALPFTPDELQGLDLEARCVQCFCTESMLRTCY